MNPYEELAGYRFGSGRDYDKRSVETFRARVLNLVDDLLNQVTQLQDEVADLRDRCRAASAEVAPLVPLPPVVPTSWLDALAGDAAGDDEVAPALALRPAAFPAPALGSWLAELESPAADDDLDDEGAGSTAELLLAAAGNAVAVQAAALATRNGDGPIPPAPAPEPVAEPAVATAPRPPAPVEPPAPVTMAPAAYLGDPAEPLPAVVAAAAPVVPPPPASPIELEPFLPGAAPTRVMVVAPGDTVVGEPPPITELSRLPIVLDDGLPHDEPLPAPVRHWGGWMRDATTPG